MPGWAGSRLCSFPHLKLCSLKSKPNLKNQGGSLFWLSLGSHARRVQFFLDTTHTCPGSHSDELLLEAGVQPQSFGAFLQGHGQDGGRVGGGAWALAQSFEPESHCCSLEPALHLWGSGSQSTASRTPPIGPLSAWTVSAALPEAPWRATSLGRYPCPGQAPTPGEQTGLCPPTHSGLLPAVFLFSCSWIPFSVLKCVMVDVRLKPLGATGKLAERRGTV